MWCELSCWQTIAHASVNMCTQCNTNCLFKDSTLCYFLIPVVNSFCSSVIFFSICADSIHPHTQFFHITPWFNSLHNVKPSLRVIVYQTRRLIAPAVHLKSISDNLHFSGRRESPVAWRSALQSKSVRCDCNHMERASSVTVDPVTVKSVSSTNKMVGMRSSLKDITRVRKTSMFS